MVPTSPARQPVCRTAAERQRSALRERGRVWIQPYITLSHIRLVLHPSSELPHGKAYTGTGHKHSVLCCEDSPRREYMKTQASTLLTKVRGCLLFRVGILATLTSMLLLLTLV